jgi:FkbM family methyltransferase
MSQSIRTTLAYILRHPLNRGRPARALSRFVGWQLKSRVVSTVEVPFAGDTRLRVTRGMTGATGNVYCGLNDYEEMGFVLHVLRPGDLFFDVGANVGSYTVLAAGAAQASCVAFEPVPASFQYLLDNVVLNELQDRVSANRIAIGAAPGSLSFTSEWGVANHALAEGEISTNAVRVPVQPLDDFWPIPAPGFVVLKIDVEGLEGEVIKGASRTLQSPSVKAVIMEILNGAESRYGYDDWVVHERMLQLGFGLYRYDTLTRTLTATADVAGGNNLYIRDVEAVRARLTSAPVYRVHGLTI